MVITSTIFPTFSYYISEWRLNFMFCVSNFSPTFHLSSSKYPLSSHQTRYFDHLLENRGSRETKKNNKKTQHNELIQTVIKKM